MFPLFPLLPHPNAIGIREYLDVHSESYKMMGGPRTGMSSKTTSDLYFNQQKTAQYVWIKLDEAVRGNFIKGKIRYNETLMYAGYSLLKDRHMYPK